MKLRLLYHGHCFDGVASAALFTRLYRARIQPAADVHYTGLLHRAGELFDDEMFDGDENAIVDFKYSASEKLSGFRSSHSRSSPEDRRTFTPTGRARKFG